MDRKEAIEVIKKNYPHVGISGYEFESALRELVPELKESEDERMRKMLVEQMERWKKCSEAHNVEQDVKEASAAIAYLEKQKEQKAIQSRNEKEYVRILKSIIADFIRDKKPEDVSFYQKIYDWLDGRHIEQKPAEWSDEDEKMRDTVIRDLERHGGDTNSAYKAEIDWLKSLRPQPHWKPSEE